MSPLRGMISDDVLYGQLAGELSPAEIALIKLLRGTIVIEDFSVTIRRKDSRFVVMQNPGTVQESGLGTGDSFEDGWNAAAKFRLAGS